MSRKLIRKNDRKLKAFVKDIIETLNERERFVVAGFGTFSTCSRKAMGGRPACTMAMFRASKELREFSSGGPQPRLKGLHSEIVKLITNEMQSEEGIVVPGLGRFAVIPVEGKSPKLIFHGSDELNDQL